MNQSLYQQRGDEPFLVSSWTFSLPGFKRSVRESRRIHGIETASLQRGWGVESERPGGGWAGQSSERVPGSRQHPNSHRPQDKSRLGLELVLVPAPLAQASACPGFITQQAGTRPACACARPLARSRAPGSASSGTRGPLAPTVAPQPGPLGGIAPTLMLHGWKRVWSRGGCSTL